MNLPSLTLTPDEKSSLGLDDYGLSQVEKLIAVRVKAALDATLANAPEELASVLKTRIEELRLYFDPLGEVPNLPHTFEPLREDTGHSPNIFDEAVETGRFRACAACGAIPTHTNTVAQTGAYTEYDNVLVMDLHGGYSLFFDNKSYSLVICHRCAHEACARLPWLAKLIDPPRSHAHVQRDHDVNTQHYGWDYDMRAQQ